MPEKSAFYSLPTLETARLLLRPLASEDCRDVYAYASDPAVARYVTWDAHRSLADAEAFVETVIKDYQQGEAAPWGLVCKADGRLVGTGGVMDWQPQYGRIELAYALARPYWGQGLMTEAVRAILEFGFKVLGVNRIQAYCMVENEGSARVMEKCGMIREGYLRQYTRIKGIYRDLFLYAILRADWQSQRQS